MKKLAIVVSHPIQYYVPIFQILTARKNIELKVFYTWSQAKEKVKDHTFGREIEWDIPLLESYSFHFSENISTSPGTHHREGIICPNLIAEIQTYSPDAILVFGWFWKSHHDVMRHFYGKIPIWFRGDSNLLDETFGLKTFLRRIYLTWVYRKVDLAFHVGKNNYDYFRKHGVNDKQLIFAPHSIDNKRFGVDYELEANRLRDELGIQKADLLILFSGKFEKKKNPLLLIEAFKKISQTIENAKLLLVGNGPLENEIKEKIKDNPKISILPFQNQSKMPVLYQLADIYCLPSQGPGETWGLAVNEAMASGRPVIVSNKVGCAIDLITESVNGFVFESNNVEELSTILNKAANSDLKEMGENAQKSIQSWSFESICDALEKTLNK
jgi:glycosyltransferase involved in cell wall biosynthesis